MRRVFLFMLVTVLALPGRASALEALSFWTHSEAHAEYMVERAGAWNERWPERAIELNVSTFSSDMIDEKLWTVLHSGVLMPGLDHPNLVDIEYHNLPRYINPLSWLLYPLDKIVGASPGAAEGAFFYRDMHMGIPVDSGEMCVYYNADALAAAGIHPEEIVTWADFCAAGRAYHAATGSRMLAVDTEHYLAFLTLYLQVEARDGTENAYAGTMDMLLALFSQNIAQMMPGGRIDSRSFCEAFASGQVGCAFARRAQVDPAAPSVYVGPVPRLADEAGVWIPGYATCMTTFCDDYTIVMDFLAFAKSDVAQPPAGVLCPGNAEPLAEILKSYKFQLAQPVLDTMDYK